MKREIYEAAKSRLLSMMEAAHIVLSPQERERVEVADFGLNDLERTGLQLLTYVNTDRCCAKEMALFPGQTCPEHRHPTLNGVPGKQETFRCRAGRVYLYVDGEPTPNPRALPPKGDEKWYTVFHEIVLEAGEQYTMQPDTRHWFQGGEKGAIVSEFSTPSHDETDIFTDPRIVRAPSVEA